MPFFDRHDEERRFTRRPTKGCRCSATLDYSNVNEGQITCTECGRQWLLMGTKGWWPHPCPACNIDPARCVHYGRRPWKKNA